MTTPLSLRAVDFAFNNDNSIFKNLSLELGRESPVMILGSSGCGKTTLLHLLAGLLMPVRGKIAGNSVPVSMAFQEPRLLPWKNALENVSLPLTQRMEKTAAEKRARDFLRYVSMENKAASYPRELSGGQKQRLNLARAFACPCELLLMDEPFQSQDIPLRLELMELTRSLLDVSRNPPQSDTRLAVIVTHDPREAIYLGKRIIALGKKGRGVIYDEVLDLSEDERAYGSATQVKIEKQLLDLLRGN